MNRYTLTAGNLKYTSVSLLLTLSDSNVYPHFQKSSIGISYRWKYFCKKCKNLWTMSFNYIMQSHTWCNISVLLQPVVDCVWNVMAHAQKPDFIFRRNGRVHWNRRGRQFNRLLAAEVCASAVIMLDTPRSEVAWRVLATHSIRQSPLHFPSRASPCAITFQLDSTKSAQVL